MASLVLSALGPLAMDIFQARGGITGDGLSGCGEGLFCSTLWVPKELPLPPVWAGVYRGHPPGFHLNPMVERLSYKRPLVVIQAKKATKFLGIAKPPNLLSFTSGLEVNSLLSIHIAVRHTK